MQYISWVILTVDPLRVNKGVLLLCLVPSNNKSVTDSEGGTRVCAANMLLDKTSKHGIEVFSQLIAVVHRSSKSRLNMSNHLPLIIQLVSVAPLW